MTTNKIKQDCRFFRTDTPCVYHKTERKSCTNCNRYERTRGRILIIKKAAMGDVLRTTCILEPLRRKFPDHRIIWFTAENNREVLKGNPYIDEIWTENIETSQKLFCFNFKAAINLDLSSDSLATAAAAKTERFYGFRYEQDGAVSWSNKPAGEWFAMSHDDGAKKRNGKTYQRIISDILELENFGEIVVPLNKGSVARAEAFAKKHRLHGKNVIGINAGSGSRWLAKRWPEKNFLKLFSLLKDEKCPIVIFGGREEKEIMKRLLKKSTVPLIDAGCDNTIGDFFALLDLCSVVLTSDTLALHAASGLRKQIVALFGPTSANEIETYGRMIKLVTPLECVCCYMKECDRKPFCMETIAPETVFSAIKKSL